MGDKNAKSFERLLNPDILRQNLVIASLFIAAFELLKKSVVDRIKGFYTCGFDKDWITSPEYDTEVLAKDSSPVFASLAWLKESGVIDDGDIQVFKRIKKSRNDVAHRLLDMLEAGLPTDLAERFAEIVTLVDKIERWWIVNVDVATDPEFDGQEVDPAAVVPGKTMALHLLVDVALGSEDDSRKYINEFLKRTRPQSESVQ